MQHAINRVPASLYVVLAKTPRIGDKIILPAGLKFVNEYYASNHLLSSERTVTVVEVFRDEIYWKTPSGESCYARFRRSA